MIIIAYTYLIGLSKLNKWYYGVRYAEGCDPSEIWKSYFTSSKYVKQFRKDNGEPDVIEIRKAFNDRKYAQYYEKRILQLLKVIGNSKWLNEGISGYPGGWNLGKPTLDNTKQKISNKHKGKTKPDWVKDKFKESAKKRKKHGRWANSENDNLEIQIYFICKIISK